MKTLTLSPNKPIFKDDPEPEAAENYKDLYDVTREAWQRDQESLEILSREYSEAIDTLATAMQQLTATQQENQALKADLAHLKALLDNATNERYELHNRLIETSARLNKELSQAIAYSDTVKKSLFAVMEQRDQLSELLNAERIARQGLAQLLKATN